MICDCGHHEDEHYPDPDLGLKECMHDGCWCISFRVGGIPMPEPTLAPGAAEA